MLHVPDFDYIIAGAGAAGVHLLDQLIRANLQHKRVLIVDHAALGAVDRTWCFWEDHTNDLESLVYRTWPNADVMNDSRALRLSLAPFSYKMIRGGDFFAYARDLIAKEPNVVFRTGIASDARTEDHSAKVLIDGQPVSAEYVFSSLPSEPVGGGVSLVQHFYGADITTVQRWFDPTCATLMDFRLPQHDETRFCYVLPYSPTSALVEFTVFSPRVLPHAAYLPEWHDYVSRILRLDSRDYTVDREEWGAIPMTDARFPTGAGARVVNLGTAGGLTKPSTGYTFLRTQDHARRIARALAHGRSPLHQHATGPGRHRLFDAVFLNVLGHHRQDGAAIFTGLFARNPTHRVFRFLDERTSLTDDIRLMAGVSRQAFLAAVWDVARHTIAAPLGSGRKTG